MYKQVAQLIINNHLTDDCQKDLNLTDNWQIAKILTDNWHLFPPYPRQTLLFVREIRLDTPFTLYLSSLRFTRSNELNSDNILSIDFT